MPPPPVPAKASDVVAPPPVWTFKATPYLWAAGLKGTVDLGPKPPPAVNVDVGFDDIVQHMRMAFMGTFEVRYQDRFGFIADISYLSVGVSATGPKGYANGDLVDKTFFGAFVGAYRVIDQGGLWVDAVAGARVWSRYSSVTLTGPRGRSLSASASESWIDPIVGVRARSYLTQQMYLQFEGDVGGFDVGAKSDWQIAGLVGYDYNKSITLFGGYRYLAVDYAHDGYRADLDMSGPVFGATFRF
jgi:hypothetical protein